jgi:hypothetical protein
VLEQSLRIDQQIATPLTTATPIQQNIYASQLQQHNQAFLDEAAYTWRNDEINNVPESDCHASFLTNPRTAKVRQ